VKELSAAFAPPTAAAEAAAPAGGPGPAHDGPAKQRAVFATTPAAAPRRFRPGVSQRGVRRRVPPAAGRPEFWNFDGGPMTNAAHLNARRRAQAVEKLARQVRKLRQRGRLTEADAEARAFGCGDIVAVPSGVRRSWMQLRDAVEGLSNLAPGG
jgi:hypothetical protein